MPEAITWIKVAGVVAVVSIIASIFTIAPDKIASDIEVYMENIDILDATNILESCLITDGYNFIEPKTITDANIYMDGFKGYCKDKKGYFLSVLSGAKIFDLETQPEEEWVLGDFKDDFTGFTHSIFINIKNGDSVHVGKMFVQM